MNRKKSSLLALVLFAVLGLAAANTVSAVNLISNPGFESGSTGWSLWQTSSGTTLDIDTQVFKEGSKSAKLTASNSGNYGVLYTYSASLLAQKNYHVRFWYKTQNLQFASNGALSLVLYYNKQGGGNGSAGVQSFPIYTQPDTEWTLFEAEATTPPETVLCQFGINLPYAIGTLWIDDIIMEDVPNLIPNAGFESGSTGWSLWQTSSGTTLDIDTQVFKEDSKSAKLTASNSGNYGALYTCSASLLAQKNYHVRFWYKTQNLQFASNGALSLVLYYNKQGGGNGSAGYQSFPISTQPNSEWTLFEAEATTPPETVLCQFGIHLPYATGTLWVDDIVMETLTISLHPFVVTRTSPTYSECLTSQPGNYMTSDTTCAMALRSSHSTARQAWYNADLANRWIPEQDYYFNELFQAGIRSGIPLPWAADSNYLGFTRMQQYNTNYGIEYPFVTYSSATIAQAISSGNAVYTNGTEIASFDSAMETVITSFITNWFSDYSIFVPYINYIQGEDEPMNNFSIFSPTANTSHQAMLTNLSSEIQANYGFGQYGLWDPYYIPADTVNDPFKRIATYRWWNSKFATHLANEQTAMDSVAPNKDFVAFSHNYVAELDNIDIAATSMYGDWSSADPYPTSVLYYYGQPRSVYSPGFSTKLLYDLSGGKNTRIHTQCFYYCGRAPQSTDIREWTSQELKTGAKWISFWTDAEPAKVTLSEHTAPYAGPYKEALRVSKIVTAMNAIALPQTTKTNILFSNQSKWGNNDKGVHSYYTTYSMLGEKIGSWFRFISDTQVDTNIVTLNNTVLNPGFEAGAQDWSLWQTSSGTTLTSDTSVFKEGAKSAKLTASNSGNLGALYCYTATLAAQQKYHVRFWYKTQNLQLGSNGYVNLVLYYNLQGGGNGSAGYQSFSVSVQPTADWTLFETDVTTAPGTVVGQFSVNLAYATGILWIDDVIMEETPIRKLIYLPQIKYLQSSLGTALYNWVQGNSGAGNRLLVVFDPEAFVYDINGTSLTSTTRSNILGGSLGSYKSGVSYIKTSSVEATSQEYFGVPANTQLPVTPLAHMTHPNNGKVLAYGITAPSGATILATYSDGSTAAYVRAVGSYGGKVVYFGVQPFGNSNLAVSDQGYASWTGFFTKMAGKVSETINLNIWRFMLPATGNDVDLNFMRDPSYQ